jgi:hypothetical protein
MEKSETKQYASRDAIGQGDHYLRHLLAMTAEGLHSKSDIAAELAHRDIQIDALAAQGEAAKARDTAVAIVDGILGYTDLSADDRTAHRAIYSRVEHTLRRLLRSHVAQGEARPIDMVLYCPEMRNAAHRRAAAA